MNSMLQSKFADYFKRCYEELFGGGMGGAVNEALEPAKVEFLGISVNPSVFTGMICAALLIIAALIIRIFVIPKFKDKPGKFQAVLESFVGYFKGVSDEKTGRFSDFVAPYTLTAAAFIAVTTLAELFGARPALADINMCLALGFTTFIVINICGFREKGIGGRLKRYINPINIITDVSVPISLSFRLFGSIMSGFIIMELVHSVIYTAIAVPAVVSVITTFFHAAIQSFLFAMLTNVFVGEAVE